VARAYRLEAAVGALDAILGTERPPRTQAVAVSQN